MSVMLQMSLIECFQTMKTILDDVSACIMMQDAQLPALLESGENGLEARKIITEHYQNIWFSRDQETTLLGMMAASADTVQHFEALNRQKMRFKEIVLSLRTVVKSKGANLMRLLGSADGTRDDDVDRALHSAGMARLNLTLCYRQFQILPDHVVSISWTEAKHVKAIKRVSFDEAVAYAYERLKEPALSMALNILAKISAKDSLAIVRPIAPAYRANIVWRAEGDAQRKMLQAHSPLVVPFSARSMVPKCRFAKDRQASVRQHRNDQKLSDHPIIEVLNLYTYQKDKLPS